MFPYFVERTGIIIIWGSLGATKSALKCRSKTSKTSMSISNCWFQPLKNMSSSDWIIIPTRKGKIKAMFQTSNQICSIDVSPIFSPRCAFNPRWWSFRSRDRTSPCSCHGICSEHMAMTVTILLIITRYRHNYR